MNANLQFAFVAGLTTLAAAPSLAQSNRTEPPADASIDAIRGIGSRLNTCWRAPHEGDQITIRLSFTRWGRVIGKPRITFLKSAEAKPDSDADLANSIFAAVQDCTPLKFTDRLGASIAGYVLTIRFTAGHRTWIL